MMKFRLALIFAAVSVAAGLSAGHAFAQEIVTIEKVPGQRLDANWHRYLNARYGLAVDIPATGFSYELSATGDGLTLTSADGEKSIAVYGSQDIDPNGKEKDPAKVFATLAEEQIDAMRLGAVNIVHSRIESYWFELSTTDAVYLYYQKGVLPPTCPQYTANLWIKYPNTHAKEFHPVVQRMSKSLTGNCSTIE